MQCHVLPRSASLRSQSVADKETAKKPKQHRDSKGTSHNLTEIRSEQQHQKRYQAPRYYTVSLAFLLVSPFPTCTSLPVCCIRYPLPPSVDPVFSFSELAPPQERVLVCGFLVCSFSFCGLGLSLFPLTHTSNLLRSLPCRSNSFMQVAQSLRPHQIHFQYLGSSIPSQAMHGTRQCRFCDAKTRRCC